MTARSDPFEGADRGRVVVAMSGGVDSSVAAALLVEHGFEVIGVFMRLGTPGDDVADACGSVRLGHRGCCSVGDAADARQVAAALGIELLVSNFRDGFGRIIAYFVDEYARGRTPNPCVRCNDWLKFGRLHEQARTLGARYVASGHYARIDRSSGGARLRRGVDADKDQSYVLFGVGRERLGEMLLPIGGMRKADVRELARARGLPVFDKPDSQEICFVPDDDYAGLVERHRPDLAPGVRGPGRIVDRDGRVVGEHAGHHRFTIGQRRGVGVALGHPIYVVDRDADENLVTVGEREHLLVDRVEAGEACWLTDQACGRRRCLAQVRAHGRALPGEVCPLEEAPGPTRSGRRGRFEVRLDQDEAAVAPGQAVVLYDEQDPSLVLGGGWIERCGRAAPASGTIDRHEPGGPTPR